MGINDFFKGIKGQASMRHPNGKFEAYCTSVSIETSNDGSKRFFKIEMATKEGKTPDYRIYMLSDFDAQRAMTDQDWKGKIVKSIEINKGVLVRLGLASDDDVVAFSQEEMIRTYAKLKHQTIKVTIMDDTKDPKYQRIFLDEIVKTELKETKQVEKTLEKIPDFSLDDIPY
jgi:hypothetical protein